MPDEEPQAEKIHIPLEPINFEDDDEKLFAAMDDIVGKTAQEARGAMSLDAQFESRMDALHQKATDIKASRDQMKKQQEAKMKVENSNAQGLGTGLSVAYVIMGFPLLGAGVGYLIDKSTGGHSAIGLGVLIGACLGVFSAIVMLNKSNSQ